MKLLLKPWQQPKVSLCWRDLTAVGTNNPYATTESVLRKECVFFTCVYKKEGKNLFCTSRKSIQDVNSLLFVLNFTCSAASQGFCMVEARLSLRLLSWDHELWTCKFCLPGGKLVCQFKSLWHMVCFCQCSSGKHSLALWGLCNRDKPSLTLLTKPEMTFFHQERRDDSKLQSRLHLNLEAWT